MEVTNKNSAQIFKNPVENQVEYTHRMLRGRVPCLGQRICIQTTHDPIHKVHVAKATVKHIAMTTSPSGRSTTSMHTAQQRNSIDAKIMQAMVGVRYVRSTGVLA